MKRIRPRKEPRSRKVPRAVKRSMKARRSAERQEHRLRGLTERRKQEVDALAYLKGKKKLEEMRRRLRKALGLEPVYIPVEMTAPPNRPVIIYTPFELMGTVTAPTATITTGSGWIW